jgi:hypothetical protein
MRDRYLNHTQNNCGFTGYHRAADVSSTAATTTCFNVKSPRAPCAKHDGDNVTRSLDMSIAASKGATFAGHRDPAIGFQDRGRVGECRYGGQNWKTGQNYFNK